MRTRGVVFGVLLTALSVVVAAPAAAGGGRLDFDNAYAVGERVEVSELISLNLGNPRLGEIKDGPFRAHLVDFRRDDYPIPLPEDALDLGEVSIDPHPRGHAGLMTLDFVVPDVRPGEYQVFVCDSPCKKPLGDLLPTPINIASDPGEALLMARIERLEYMLFNVDSLLKVEVRRRAGLRKTATELKEALVERLDESERRASALEARIDSLESSRDEQQGPLSALAIGGFLVLTMALVTYSRRKRPESSPGLSP